MYLVLALLFVQLTTTTILARETSSFTAAIYEVNVAMPDRLSNVSRTQAISMMRGRLAKYSVVAKDTAKLNVDIMVFPEYGLFAEVKDLTRNSVTNFLDSIPDPTKIEPWIPCDNPGLYPNTEIQESLSCMAKENGIYIVVNLGDKHNCNPNDDLNCPADGRYQYNTNVVYSSNGTLVARYHKKHLFYEPYFNSPPTADYAVFDTPFGRFATIVCFDILFKDTLIDLIEKHKVRNILFPNLWVDIPPFFLSIPFHRSIAKAAKINLISANMKIEGNQYNRGGSGLYTPRFKVYTTTRMGKHGSLLKLDVRNLKDDDVPSFPLPPKRKLPKSDNPQVKSTFMYKLLNFSTVTLLKQKGVVSVCEQGACCALEYEFHPKRTPKSEVNYILAAGNQEIFFSNNKDAVNTQSCVLCPVNNETLQCLQTLPENVTDEDTIFRTLKMYTVNFNTRYLFPQLNSFKANTTIQCTHSKGQIEASNVPRLYSAIILGRVYYSDGPTSAGPTSDGPNSAASYTYTVSVCTLVMMTFILGYLIV
uniref:Symplectin/biotinidase-like protein 2 n=1 Tax=Vampyroteuthis infernalis TaxID=55288 RepID=A0A2Z5EQ29_9MOLL|nr:symplectin/biotinidase-like protein 2 [Vampyroteuthis infernalis]